MPRLLRLHAAAPLGTPDVERSRGKLSELVQEHRGAVNGEIARMSLAGALELEANEDQSLYGATLPLEALRHFPSNAATKGKERTIRVSDVRRAFFHAPVSRLVKIELQK